MSILKDLQQFPSIYTFKVVGESSDDFKKNVKKIFDLPDREVRIKETASSGGKYSSFSVTTIIMDYDELEKLYTDVSKLEGLKFYV